MSVTVEPEQSRRHRLRPSIVYLVAFLTGLASLPFTAYDQWSGPTPGWAAPAFSFIGSIVFCDWIASGAPSTPGAHDVDLCRAEMTACAAGFVANVLFVVGLIAGPFGARRLARIFGRAALALGVACSILMKIGVPTFELRGGGYLWIVAMALLAWSGGTVRRGP
jgi:hypothetical protein